MKKIIVLGFLAFGLLVLTQAQSYSRIGWDYSIPVGSTADFIDMNSSRGFNLEFGQLVHDELSVGFFMGWNVFYQEIPDQAYTNGDFTLSGKQYRYINSFPLMLDVRWIVPLDSDLMITLGSKGGTYSISERTDMGVYSVSSHKWHWGLAPQIGISYPIGWDTRISLDSRYNYAFKTKSTPEYSYLSLNLGIIWGL